MKYKVLLLLALTIGCVPVIVAQPPSMEDFDKWDSTHKNLDSANATILKELVIQAAGKSDPKIVSKQIEYFNFTIDHRIRVLRWQLYSSVIIFFMVIFIVLSGIYLSYKQFSRAYRTKVAKLPAPSTNDPASAAMPEFRAADLNANLELGKDGVKINTAVIGLVILIISIAFFYLYLNYAFTVSILK